MRERESVSLTPALSRCCALSACEQRVRPTPPPPAALAELGGTPHDREDGDSKLTNANLNQGLPHLSAQPEGQGAGRLVDSGQAREMFTKYAAALAYVEVESPDGDLGIGSAFHVGEGVFVTARHVVEGRRINEICITESTYVPLTGPEAETTTTFIHQKGEEVPVHWVRNRVLRLKAGPYFHPDPGTDVAVFQVHEIDPYTPIVPLGDHLDDWLGQSDFVLTEAVVLGYPPIPMTKHPVLVGARAEVNAQVDLYDSPNVHFILSATARGGFSGGVAFHEYGFALGLVTRSLLANEGASESGYMSVLTVEPIYECLSQHKLLPDCQAEIWDGFWNTDTLNFTKGNTRDSFARAVHAATVAVFDDGKRHYVTVCCDDNVALFDQAIQTAETALQGHGTRTSEVRPQMHRIHIVQEDSSASAAVLAAAREVAKLFIANGYQPTPLSSGAENLLPATSD